MAQVQVLRRFRFEGRMEASALLCSALLCLPVVCRRPVVKLLFTCKNPAWAGVPHGCDVLDQSTTI